MKTSYSHDANGRRDDVHAPSAINPGDYSFVCVGDERKHPVDGGPGGTCHHCGKAIRWAVVHHHQPSGVDVTFGETCSYILGLSNDRSQHEMVVLKRKAAAERKKYFADMEVADRREAFDIAEPILRDWFTEHDFDSETNFFLCDMKRAYERWGSLTPRQAEALHKALKAREDYYMRLLAQPTPTAPLKAGRYEIKGEILSIRWNRSGYYPHASTLKALILMEDGNKVWGTIPQVIEDAVQKGTKIVLTATVKPKEGDEHFGYYSRPSKGSVA